MVLHPDVQTKGQEEIDRVIGRSRLPTFEDRPFLPYTEAIYREVMRLYPPLPLGEYFKTLATHILSNIFVGVEHSLIEDDIYLGYHIPKGSFWCTLCVDQLVLNFGCIGCSVIPNIGCVNITCLVDGSLTTHGQRYES